MSQRNIFYYDNRDNLSCVRDPDLGLTYYTYDGLSRMTSVKNPHGEVTYYEYTPGGQVKQKILGNGAVSYYSYDAARRISRIQHVKSDMSVLATLDYEYDRVGNPTKITREDGSATYYDYDGIYQLTGETQVGSGGVEYAFEYDYDGAHNRTVKVVDGVPTYYTYNEANELLTETTGGETTYYHYDGRGNTVAKQEAAGTTYYQYNTENLMTRIDFAAGGSSYYHYDADSKRVSQRTADGYKQFVYQGPDMLKLQMERDESEETVAHYTMGSGLEAMRRDSASSFYHYNHLGTALALTGADEAVTDTYRHDAWGVLLASTGSTVNPHTYVGRERYYGMPNAAMYHLGFRDYAQGVGRFMTVDPILLASVPLDRIAPTDKASDWPDALGGRIRGALRAFPEHAPMIMAAAYSYVINSPTYGTDPDGELPRWRDVWWDLRHLEDIIRQLPDAYWDYYVKEPLDWWYCDPSRDKWSCIADCIERASLAANMPPIGLAALVGMPISKQTLAQLGIRIVKFGGSSDWTTVGSVIQHLTRAGATRLLGRLLVYLGLPLGGWEIGTWARCLGRCL